MPPDAKLSAPGEGRQPQDHPQQTIDASVDQPVASATRFRPGDLVRCERQAPPRGSWSRFAGREGVVVSVNVARSVNGSPDVVEYGVDLDSDGRTDAWFRPDELAVIGTPAATSARLTAETGGGGR